VFFSVSGWGEQIIATFHWSGGTVRLDTWRRMPGTVKLPRFGMVR